MFEAHFQSFDDRTDGGAAAERVKALRTELFVRGLDGFIVPRADRFQNEYVPPSDERLAWLTGFSGSAGMAIILADRAVLFVDGRYQVQVRDEVDAAVFTIEHLVENPPPAWIKANLPTGAKLGYSPWLHTIDGALRLSRSTTIRSTPSGPTGPSRRSARWSRTTCAMPAKRRPANSSACAPSL
jgi:Xaa-Pro aminopeptidase